MTAPKSHLKQTDLPSSNRTTSYWLHEPSKLLFNHRTTEGMPQKADVIIIGSGISGSSAVYWLREHEVGKELDVVMLEAREACWGATGRNGGLAHPILYSTEPQVASFELRNWEQLRSLILKNDIPCDWRECKNYHVYMTELMFKTAVERTRSLKERDPELGRLVEAIDRKSTDPSLHDLRCQNAAGLILTKKGASLWAYKLVVWMLERALGSNTMSGKKRSFNLQTNTPVTKLERAEDGSWKVHTPRGSIISNKILLTTNAHTSYLLPSFSDLIVPMRGEVSSLVPPPSMNPENTPNPPLDCNYAILGHAGQNINQDDYVIQRPYTSGASRGGELIFGGGRLFASASGVGFADDSTVDENATSYLRRELPVALDLRNDKEELKASCAWSGTMGYSRDLEPWVGRLDEEVRGGEGGCGVDDGEGEERADLPSMYRFSKERVERARSEWGTVAETDTKTDIPF